MKEHPYKRTNPALDVIRQRRANESAQKVDQGSVLDRVKAAVLADIKARMQARQEKAQGFGSPPQIEGAKVENERRRIRIFA